MRSTSDIAYRQGMVIKLHPSDAKKRIIAVNGNASRAVYNFLVATDRELHRLKRTGLYVSTVAERISYLESVIRNYRGTWKRMREQHTGIPTFHRKGSTLSYQTCAHYRNGADGINDGNVHLMDMSSVRNASRS